jgi:rhodanese-related sulfurtransferase
MRIYLEKLGRFSMVALPRILVVLLLALAVPAAAYAQDVPKIKQTKLGKYVTATQAAEMLKAERGRILFVDVRTRAEVQFVGYATDIDGVVPFVEMSQFAEWDDANGRYKLEPNASFSDGVTRLLQAKGLGKADKVILICRSGDRSSRGADLLAEAGYTNAYTVIDGVEGDLSPEGRRTVNGWKNAGLPWTYKMDKAKTYAPMN